MPCFFSDADLVYCCAVTDPSVCYGPCSLLYLWSVGVTLLKSGMATSAFQRHPTICGHRTNIWVLQGILSLSKGYILQPYLLTFLPFLPPLDRTSFLTNERYPPPRQTLCLINCFETLGMNTALQDANKKEISLQKKVVEIQGVLKAATQRCLSSRQRDKQIHPESWGFRHKSYSVSREVVKIWKNKTKQVG